MKKIYFFRYLNNLDDNTFLNEEEFNFFYDKDEISNKTKIINVENWNQESVKKLVKYFFNVDEDIYFYYQKWNKNLNFIENNIINKQKKFANEQSENEKVNLLISLIIAKENVNKIFLILNDLSKEEKISVCLFLFKYSNDLEIQNKINLAINTNLISLKQVISYTIFNLWGKK